MEPPHSHSSSPLPHSTKQLDLENICLIDVSLEDDSLLPEASGGQPLTNARRESSSSTNVAVHSSSGLPISKYCRMLPENEGTPQGRGNEQVTLPETHSDKRLDLQQPLSVQEPVLPRRKKRTSKFNLRKSLAWNNAFLTDEGVLDPEELSIVNRTFKKPTDLPKQNLFKRPVATQIVETSFGVNANSALSNLEKSMFNVHPQQVELSLEQGQQRRSSSIASPASSTGSNSESGFGNLDQHGSKEKVVRPSLRVLVEHPQQINTNIKLTTAGTGSSVSKSVLPKKVVDDGIQRRTHLRLPSSFSGKKSGEKSSEELHRIAAKESKGASSKNISPSSISNLTRKVSSVSRKMKDKFGKVLPGHSSGHKDAALLAHDDSQISTSSPNSLRPDSPEVAKLARCYSYTTLGRFGPPISEASPKLAPSKKGFSYEVTAPESHNPNPRVTKGENIIPVRSPLLFSSETVSAVSAPTELKASLVSHGKSVADESCSRLDSQSQKICTKGQVPERSLSTGGDSGSSQLSSGDSAPYRAKPSGLRKPSPKLGFFDPVKAAIAPQLTALLPEKPVGFGSVKHSERSSFSSSLVGEAVGATNPVQKTIRTRYSGIPPGRSTHPETLGLAIRGGSLPSSIPSAPHLYQPERGHSPSTPSSPPPPGRNSYFSSMKAQRFPHCPGNTWLTRKYPGSSSPRETAYIKRSSSTNDVTPGKLNHQPTPESADFQKIDQLLRRPVVFKLEVETTYNTDGDSSCRSAVNGDCSTQEVALGGGSEPKPNHEKQQNHVQSKDASSFAHSPQSCRNDNRETVNTTNTFAPELSSDILSQVMSKSASSAVTTRPSTPLLQKKIEQSADSTSCWSDWPALGAIPPGAQAWLLETSGPSSPVRSPVQGSKFVKVDNSYNVDSPTLTSADLNRSNGRSPLVSSNGGNVVDQKASNNQLKKEKGSIFAFAKKAVSRLTLSPLSGDDSGQENGFAEGKVRGGVFQKMKRSKSFRSPSRNTAEEREIQRISNVSPFSERICALQAAGQEWFETKSGAVQNSPPEKTSPKAGPWSPVRRNVQELGPFDCTKCLNAETNADM